MKIVFFVELFAAVSYPTLLRVPYPSIMKMVIHCVMPLGLERSMFQLVEGKDRFVPYILVYIIYSERHQESGQGAPKGIRFDVIMVLRFDGVSSNFTFLGSSNKLVNKRPAVPTSAGPRLVVDPFACLLSQAFQTDLLDETDEDRNSSAGIGLISLLYSDCKD